MPYCWHRPCRHRVQSRQLQQLPHSLKFGLGRRCTSLFSKCCRLSGRDCPTHTQAYLLLLAIHSRHLDHSMQRLGQLAPLGRQLPAVATAQSKVEK